jgi:hypothetical protein
MAAGSLHVFFQVSRVRRFRAVLNGLTSRYCDSAMPAARITLPQRSISDFT